MSATRRPARILGALFFTSGFAALCYEVVFAKRLALIFGSTARAAAVVLAVYMTGIALGSWVGGRGASKLHRPLFAYALCELGIALWCALSGGLAVAVGRLYVVAASGADPGSGWVVVLQMALSALVLLPPTFLMGLTLPMMSAELDRAEHGFGRSVGWLYAANTLGAAFGALATGYAILPALGVWRTTLLAVALNCVAAYFGVWTDKRASRPSLQREVAGSSSRMEMLADRTLGAVSIIVLAIGGILTFALETTYIHLLAVVAGNSAYAFSLMLFCFLLGLSTGAGIGRVLLRTGQPVGRLLILIELGLAAAVLGGVFGWDEMPRLFASLEGSPVAGTFIGRESVRFAVCMMAMLPSAVMIGAAYPVAIEGVGRLNPAGRLRSMGLANALNTVGNVLGALLGNFVLVPRLGSLRSLQLIAVGALALAVGVAAAAGRPRRTWVPAVFAVPLLLLFLQPPSFDWDLLSSGANVYFSKKTFGRVIDHAESAEGGLTSVAESFGRDGRRTLTLLTNGKFQGDDHVAGEVAAQSGFTLFPLLHTWARGSALVIGFGTGNSARVAHDAGFSRLRVAELSEDIVRLAAKHFVAVNQRVLERPNVTASISDGRNLLLLSNDHHDLIGIEVTSIWFAGAASLYSREFYALAKERLSDRGVLQQWLQLHRLDPEDLVSIIATLRAEFRWVWVYLARSQAVLVSCAWECRPSAETLAKLDGTPRLAADLALWGGSASQLLRHRLLTPDDVDRLLAEARVAGVDVDELISTDDNLRLEYTTPRGNVLPYAQSFNANLELLRRYATSSVTAGTPSTGTDARPSLP